MAEKNIRLRAFLISIIIITVIMITRIVYLSFKSPEDFNILEKGEFTVRRGDIYDRNGKLLAVSDELDSLYANPREIKDIEKTASVLSKIVNIPERTIRDNLDKKRSFVWLKRQISPKQAELIKSFDLQGISLKKEYKRFYPNKKLASQILGFCNIDSRGVEGIEKSMDSYLIARPGESDIVPGSNTEGFNVVLTVDGNIQALAERVISEAITDENAGSGSLILMDGVSGEVLCMANYPDYDPNSYKEFSQEDFRNNSIFNQFEPGSIFKIFTIASLLDKNLLERSDFFFCDGAYQSNGITVKCTGHHGSLNYYGILKYSCNSGMLEAAEKINEGDLYYYLKLFGFGGRTSVLLPGEQPGILRNSDSWSIRSKLAIPIGQEVSVNALQIMQATTTFLNDGIMVEPLIVKAITDINGNIIKTFDKKEIRRVVKSGVSQEILNAMKSSTSPGGTVTMLKIEGIDFAAKSGTGQIYDPKLRKYLENDFTSSLLLVFPFDRPKYIAFIVFNRPKGRSIWGGVIGSIAFNKFISSLTGYIDLPTQKKYYMDVKSLKIRKEFNRLKDLPSKMPDLTGLNANDVMDIFSESGIEIRAYGNGLVYRQIPEKEELINKNTIVKLYLKD
jgi:cell division protein FtsI (penicillin-binding protein 3)